MGLLIHIHDTSGKPVFRQIMDQIMELVDSATLKPGTRLPSTRSLATQLGVNRSTVYNAYQELWALGYLESRPGSYSTVRSRPKVVSGQQKPASGLFQWHEKLTPGSNALYDSYRKETDFAEITDHPETISFISLEPDSRLFPVDAFRKCLNHVLIANGPRLLRYGIPPGYGPLREFIARRMRLHRISVSADEIMITAGAQHAIELLLKLLADPGDTVVMETPTYSRAMDSFRLGSMKPAAIVMNPDGMDLDELEHLLQHESPAMIYTIPTFHNPTGITTGQPHRERLLNLCERYRIPLVEDGFEEEMKYFGRAVLPIKSMDHRGVVIYLGTFSKVLFPGLRIGWIAADKACIERLMPIQRTSLLSGNLLDQAALDRFCRQGGYDLHVKRMHRIYRNRMVTALKAAETYLPASHVTWTRPSGGYCIWVRLRNLDMDEDQLIRIISDHQVAVSPGSRHFLSMPGNLYFRLSISQLNEAEIETGMSRLGEALFSICAEKRSGR